MKRVLCTSIVLVMLLAACSAPVQQVPLSTEPTGNYIYGVYELDFNVERLSGWPFEGWDFVYTCNGEEIQNGYQVLLSVEIFTFYSVQVNVIEQDNPKNSYSAAFPVAICHGGSGETKITATGSNGKTVTFGVTCLVTQVGRQSLTGNRFAFSMGGIATLCDVFSTIRIGGRFFRGSGRRPLTGPVELR